MAESKSVEALNGEQKRQVEQQNDDLREEVVAKSQFSESEQVVELSSSQVVIDELSESRFEALVASPTCTRRVPKANDQCVGSQDNLRLESHVDASELKRQDGISGPNVLESGTGQCAEAQTENQHQSCVCPASLSELSPTSVTQSISSAPSPTLLEPSLSPSKVNNTDACIHNADQQNSSKLRSLSLQIGKAHISDGYNWRKYGQKQVKSPKGSRSYYKCTYSDCCAKKIECADHSGHVIDIVNKGAHSHDPPRKNNCTRESKVALSSPPVPGDSITEPSTTVPMDSTTERSTSMLTDSNQSSLSKGSLGETPMTPDKKRQNFSGLNENGRILNTEEHISEPEPKRRVKKENLECAGSLPKPGKKPKFVVHAAGDVGISGDGHRWRKYGQKMVKGNPNPRNYYRCTSAGCPVRKHIETAADSTNAVIITYKGVHDHDMPVPKKRHGPPSAPLVAAAAPASLSSSQLKKTDTLSNQASSTQWSVGKEGELTSEALDLGGEKDKAIESARTLLSIGFEIKPC